MLKKQKASPEFIFELEALARAAGAKDIGYEKVKARFKGNPHAPQFHISVEVPMHTGAASGTQAIEFEH